MPRFWYTCLKILMKHIKTLIQSVQILRCLLCEFCLVVFFFSVNVWHIAILKHVVIFVVLAYIQWLVHSAIAFEQVISASNIFSYVSKIRMSLNLLNVKIDPQVTVALVVAYCISLDASTACAVHILVLLK